MKVVFCLYGNLLEEATMMVASCKRFGYEVWQMTDMDTPEIAGVDTVVRRPMDVPQVLYRYKFLCDMDAPYLSLDVDLLLFRDVSDGFDAEYDVCLTKRDNKLMPYNGGVFFVQNNDFIRDCTRLIENMPAAQQDWTGGQLAMRMVAETGKHKVKELPCFEWNNSTEVKMPKGARIVHFKGQKRRKFMKQAYEYLRSRRQG